MLAAFLVDRARGPNSELIEWIVTALFLLPWAAIILAIVALKRLKPPPDTGSDHRRKFAGTAAWLGLLLGGVGPFLLIFYAMDQGS